MQVPTVPLFLDHGVTLADARQFVPQRMQVPL